MQGMGDVLHIKTNRLTTAHINAAALSAALCLHVLLLLSEFGYPHFDFASSRVESKLSISIEPTEKELPEPQVSDPPTLEKPEVTLVEQTTSNQVESEQTQSQAQSESTSPDSQTSQLLSKESSKVTQEVVVPSATVSLNSDAFQRFLKTETLNALDQNPEAAGEFAESFKAPPKPDISDTDPKVGNLGGPLGGGSFKFRKNGVECQGLRMIPQTFDELTGAVPTISTGGNCKDLKKKIDLLDKDGKIKNSDRYDWP